MGSTNYDNLYIYTKDLITPYDFVKGLQNSNEYFIVFAMWENTMISKNNPKQFKNLDEVNNNKLIEALFKLCWGKDAEVPKDWKKWNPKPFKNTSSKCLSFYLISNSGNNDNALKNFYKQVNDMNVYNAIHIPPIIQKLQPYQSNLYKKQDECISIDCDQDVLPVIQDVILNYYSKTFLPITKIYCLIGDSKRLPDVTMTKMDPDIKRNIKIFYLPDENERDDMVNNLLNFDKDLKKAFMYQRDKLIGSQQAISNCVNNCQPIQNQPIQNQHTLTNSQDIQNMINNLQDIISKNQTTQNQTTQNYNYTNLNSVQPNTQNCINNCLNSLTNANNPSTDDAPSFKDLLNTGFKNDTTDVIYDNLGNPIVNAKNTDDVEKMFDKLGKLCADNKYSYITDFNIN